MSLLQVLTYKDYKKALNLSIKQCEKIARLSNLSVSFSDTNKPGELLMKELDKTGCTLPRYNELISMLNFKTILTYYKPQAKVAILIANDKYKYLSKLATPSVDCEAIGAKLKELGFIVVTIKNTDSAVLKEIFVKLCDCIPEDSYGLVFYAGHGCQFCNTKCLLCIDTPIEDIQMKHCVSENFILKELYRQKLDLCINIMDMCRVSLDRDTNPEIYKSMCAIEEYQIHKNLIMSFSCASAQQAYEMLQIECSVTLDADVTYEIRTKDLDKIVPTSSQYVNALCARLHEDVDVSSLLDKVHAVRLLTGIPIKVEGFAADLDGDGETICRVILNYSKAKSDSETAFASTWIFVIHNVSIDLEHSVKKQTPFKVQCGTAKRSLYDPAIGDTATVLANIREVAGQFSDYCTV